MCKTNMSDMTSLIAGIVASDGHIDKEDKGGIRIISKSEEFIKQVVVPSLENLTKKKPTIHIGKSGYKGTKKFIVYIYDTKLRKLLTEKYKIPPGKKSIKIEPPDALSNEEEVDYLRGWFTGEGSPTKEVHHKNGKIYTQPKIELWVKNEKITKWIGKILSKLNISSSVYYDKKKEQYLTVIRKIESLKLFKEKIGFAHPEKERKFKNLLRYPRIRTS